MEVTPYQTGESKKIQVQTMFDSVAPKYDFLNHFLSLGIDKIWRKKTVRELAKLNPKNILDIATGTADLAIAAAALQPQHITGIDISEGMLSIGRKKIEEKKLTGLITLQQGDSENLPFKDGTFDAVMVAFGVRNFQHLQQGLTEMKRMLHTGGKLFILEFSKPTAFPVKQLYAFYSTFILPFLGKFISGDKAAYSYLPQSVQHFPSGNELALILNECGFNNVEIKPFTFGIVTLYIAWP